MGVNSSYFLKGSQAAEECFHSVVIENYYNTKIFGLLDHTRYPSFSEAAMLDNVSRPERHGWILPGRFSRGGMLCGEWLCRHGAGQISADDQ